MPPVRLHVPKKNKAQTFHGFPAKEGRNEKLKIKKAWQRAIQEGGLASLPRAEVFRQKVPVSPGASTSILRPGPPILKREISTNPEELSSASPTKRTRPVVATRTLPCFVVPRFIGAALGPYDASRRAQLRALRELYRFDEMSISRSERSDFALVSRRRLGVEHLLPVPSACRWLQVGSFSISRWQLMHSVL